MRVFTNNVLPFGIKNEMVERDQPLYVSWQCGLQERGSEEPPCKPGEHLKFRTICHHHEASHLQEEHATGALVRLRNLEDLPNNAEQAQGFVNNCLHRI